MKHPFVRGLVAVLAGMVAAFLLVFVIELVSTMVYPMPADLDPQDREAMSTYVARLSPGAFAFVLAAWTAGAFAGVWIATRIARSWVAGVVVALLFLGACAMNLVALPHPIWFWAAAVILVTGAAAVALRLGTVARTMRAA